MQTTPNLGLKKPESNEYIKITDLNDNADIIDESMNTKVTASGGAISETLVDTLETIETKFPIPSAGEKVKTFFGKILTFLRNIKPLESDVTYYVATTGSDSTGDGTQEKPFKTPQKAVDVLPKNLNNYTATIMLSDGVYDTISIIGFSIGTLLIRPSSRLSTLNDDCVVKNIVIYSCKCLVHLNSLKVVEPTGAKAIDISRTNVVRLGHLKIVQPNPAWTGIEVYTDSAVVLQSCEISNHANAVYADFSKIFMSDCTGSGNNYSMNVSSGGLIVYNGTTPGYTAGFSIQNTGGTLIRQNGTQISEIVNSGLSCTWGTIGGGIVRNGITGGTGMITLQVRVTLTTNLTALNEYAIGGFPIGMVDSCCSVNLATDTANCYIAGSSGQIRFTPKNNMSAPIVLVFNATYLTKS